MYYSSTDVDGLRQQGQLRQARQLSRTLRTHHGWREKIMKGGKKKWGGGNFHAMLEVWQVEAHSNWWQLGAWIGSCDFWPMKTLTMSYSIYCTLDEINTDWVFANEVYHQTESYSKGIRKPTWPLPNQTRKRLDCFSRAQINLFICDIIYLLPIITKGLKYLQTDKSSHLHKN